MLTFNILENEGGPTSFSIPLLREHFDKIERLILRVITNTDNLERVLFDFREHINQALAKLVVLQSTVCKLRQKQAEKLSKKRSKKTKGQAIVINEEQFDLEEKERI
jgi:hypothetical protein